MAQRLVLKIKERRGTPWARLVTPWPELKPITDWVPVPFGDIDSDLVITVPKDWVREAVKRAMSDD